MNSLTKAWRTADQFVARGFKAFTMIFGFSHGTPSWSYWWSDRTRYDYAGAVGAGTNNSAVANCLAWITGAFPQAPLIVEEQRGTEWEQLPDHLLTRLIRRPNPFYSRSQLWAATLTSYHTDGNAYWIKRRSREGVPIEVWYVPHTQIEPISDDEKTFIEFYRYSVGGQQIDLPPSEVVHFRNGLDPDNVRLGRAPLKAALREVYADDEAALMVGTLMRNQGVPGIIVSPSTDQGSISADEAHVMKAEMEARTGGDNRGRVLVLGGSVKVDKLAFSPDEMNTREIRWPSEERISGSFRLPAIIAGLGAGLSRSTFSNYAEAREAAWEDNIIPTQTEFADALTLQLLPDFSDPNRTRVGFDISKIRVLQDDESALTDRLVKQLQAGGITVAEFRRDLGRDADASHDVYMVPSGYEVRAELEPPEPERRSTVAETIEDPAPQLEAPTDDEITALLGSGRE